MHHSLPLVWRRIPERYNLIGNKCETCGTQYFPSRKICPKCRRRGKLVKQRMPRTGKIYSFTRVHSTPAGFEHESPYWLGVIELDNGAHLLSQIVDSPEESVVIGAPVRVVFRRIYADASEGIIAYGYKFKVA
jgi:uncharacterized OB-fold protein